MTTKNRCGWSGSDPLYVAYHDEEWGVPVHDDRLLFEFLILEGAQAGLSWITILRKRDAYRRAFDKFDPRKVARYDRRKVAALLGDAGIVRNRAKIESAIKNAKAFLGVQAQPLTPELKEHMGLNVDRGADDVEKIKKAYRLLFAREATDTEVQMGLDFLRENQTSFAGSPTAWQQYAQVLFGSNEFSFVN